MSGCCTLERMFRFKSINWILVNYVLDNSQSWFHETGNESQMKLVFKSKRGAVIYNGIRNIPICSRLTILFCC